MTWKDKLEIGLKDDAPFRRDNLPDFQKEKSGPETKPGDSTRSPEEPGARQDAAATAGVPARGRSKPKPKPAAGSKPRPKPPSKAKRR